MKVTETPLVDASIITVDKYEDDRGFFMESFNEQKFIKELGHYEFVQDNHSKSSKGVLRGLHYQIEHPQGKLLRCTQGKIWDVLVDLRKSSRTFGLWFNLMLDDPATHIWVPPGFAHGFYTLTDTAEVQYKTTDYYYPQHERSLLWSELDILWPIAHDGSPSLSKKDAAGKTFEECEKYE
tara:strand:- start:195 stop:734 length:540 start_codon:yes stop_codon:yes gene_type:complete